MQYAGTLLVLGVRPTCVRDDWHDDALDFADQVDRAAAEHPGLARGDDLLVP